jgi:putative ABC transport system permease protein
MILIEAFKMALAAIGAHKLRSALTLVGIIAGVAAIISVMTGVSIVQNQMEAELSVLGGRVFQLQKWPPGGFGNNGNRNWREIQRFPPLTIADADLIRDRVKTVDLVGSEYWKYNSWASFRGEKTESMLMICGGTPEYPENNTHYVQYGRNISNEDVKVRRDVVVIGHAVAQELFPFSDPIGAEIRVDGRKYVVQGVFAEKKSATGGSFDNYILMPITVFIDAYGARDGRDFDRSVNITVRAASAAQLEDAIAESRAVLRAARRLSPRDDDNFFYFTSDSQIEMFNTMSAKFKRGAFVLGIVALLVAGIGIMNIMLVSVTERTREIGIRKALGAKRHAILLQFLLEAIVLCNLGGAVGVLVGFGLGNLVPLFTDFAVHVPMDWAVRGLVFCSVVGVVFGMWPAIRASRLVPVEALSFE